MDPEHPPDGRDEEGPTWTGGNLEDEAAQEPRAEPQPGPEPESEPEPRSGSIPPPGVPTTPPPAAPRVKRGGLLARLRGKLGR